MDLSFLNPVVLCILVTETVERFAYYGFRAILVLYFIHALEYSEETAIALYAYVICLAYASPLLGAILADGQLGRYTTILWFGWVYAAGLAILTVGASVGEGNLRLSRILSFVGLVLVCMGVGGIKPCVSAFGADQVASIGSTSKVENPELLESSSALNANTTASTSDTTQSENLRAFFASFYFCINLGAVTSVMIIPVVKHHFGFAAAFLLPTIFIVCAMLIFLSKHKEYVHRIPGEDGTSLSTTFSLCFWLLRNDLSRTTWILRLCPWILPQRSPIDPDRTNNNTIEAAADIQVANQQQLSDAKQALRVVPIMCMFPIFWMLFDQQSSVWTLQANRMQLHGFQPEQLSIVNPVEIMFFVPLFDRVIYPFLEALGFNVSHLGRMRWGMVLAAIAFSMSGFLETMIQQSETANSISVLWQLPQITLLAMAEILLSVTGLEFAYSTSPERLKAFIMGIYLVMTAVGNFFGGLLYSSVFQTLNRATVMHICAALMLANLVVFCWVGQSWEKHKEHEALKETLEMATVEEIDSATDDLTNQNRSDSGSDSSSSETLLRKLV